MSALLMGRAFYAHLPAHLKMTLLALADESDDEGRGIFIGQTRLATKTGASERTVRTNLGELRERGFVVRKVQKHPDYGTDQYELVLDKLPVHKPSPEEVAARKHKPLLRRHDRKNLPERVAAAPVVASRKELPVAGVPTGSPASLSTGSGLPLTHENYTREKDQNLALDSQRVVFGAVCDVMGYDYTTLDEADGKEVGGIAKALRLKGLDADSVLVYAEWLLTSTDSPLVKGGRLRLHSLPKWVKDWRAEPRIVQSGSLDERMARVSRLAAEMRAVRA